MEKREHTTALSITFFFFCTIFVSVFMKTVGLNSSKLGRQISPWPEGVPYHFELAPPTTSASGWIPDKFNSAIKWPSPHPLGHSCSSKLKNGIFGISPENDEGAPNIITCVQRRVRASVASLMMSPTHMTTTTTTKTFIEIQNVVPCKVTKSLSGVVIPV